MSVVRVYLPASCGSSGHGSDLRYPSERGAQASLHVLDDPDPAATASAAAFNAALGDSHLRTRSATVATFRAPAGGASGSARGAGLFDVFEDPISAVVKGRGQQSPASVAGSTAGAAAGSNRTDPSSTQPAYGAQDRPVDDDPDNFIDLPCVHNETTLSFKERLLAALRKRRLLLHLTGAQASIFRLVDR